VKRRRIGALRTSHSEFRIGNCSFPEFILGWTIGAIGVRQSLSDAMTIAQPFMAGSSVNPMEKSREGRQNGSFVPDGLLIFSILLCVLASWRLNLHP